MKTKRYAEGTDVTVSKSREELERLLERHGAAQIQVTRDANTKRAVVIFKLQDRCIRLEVKVSAADVPLASQSIWKNEAAKFPQGWPGWSTESTIEREFLADIMLPDGSTVHESLAQKLAQSYTDGSMPPLLLSGRTT